MDDVEDLPPQGDEGDVAAPVEQNEPAQPELQPTTEDLASEMGWKPQDQWKGDPDKWRPAAEFLRSTVKVNRNLTEKVRSVEDRISRISRMQEIALEKALERQRAELQAEADRAWDENDKGRYREITTQIDQLKVPVEQPALSPELDDFKARNPWFQQDQDATRWAAMRGDELAKQGISPQRQLQIVEREAKQLFPDLYPAEQAPARPAPLNKPGARAGRAVAKGFSSLPAEAQKAADYYVSKGVFKDREEYAKSYFEEQEA